MPEDRAGFLVERHTCRFYLEVGDSFRIKMNFAVIAPCESLKELRQSAFGTVAAIHKGRNYGEAQVTESRVCWAVPRHRWQTERQARALVGGTALLKGATNRHLK